MRKELKSLLSMLLVVAMLIEVLPATIFATEDETDRAAVQAVNADEPVTAREETYEEMLQSAEILFEDTALREENVKHFRLDNGANVAIVYDTPVHYLDEEGTWQDIDNTFSAVSYGGRVTTYRVENGDSQRIFAADANAEQLVAVQKGDYSMILTPVQDGDETEEELPFQPDPEVLPMDVQDTESEATGDTPYASDVEADADAAIEDPQESFEGVTTVGTAESIADPQQTATAADSVPEDAQNFAVILSNDANAEEVEDDLMAKVEPENIYSALQYNDAINGAALRYENYANTIKESIVVEQPRDAYTYTFRMELDGLTPTLWEDGSITLAAEDGSVIYSIPAPYMIDANEAYSYDAAYTLQADEDAWLLTVTADAAWMNSNDRAYPILIDPTITETAESDADICGAYVRNGYPSSPDTSDTGLYVGNNGNAVGLTRSYFHINDPIRLPYGTELCYAGFSLYQYTYNSGTTPMNVGLYEVTAAGSLNGKSAASSWQNWANNLTWNQTTNGTTTNGTTTNGTTVIDSQAVSSATTGTYVTWDISTLAFQWYDSEDGVDNRGFMLKAMNETDLTSRVCFYGPKKTSNRPRMTILYRSTRGIEPKYTYQTVGIGRAGTAYINDFSLQNTMVVPLFSSPSNVMPFSLSLIYDSSLTGSYFSGSYLDVNTKNYDNMLIGIGWKLSLQETVTSLSVGGTTYLVYNDADGTEHYFRYVSGAYYDEDGLGLKITGSSSSYTMSDDMGNTKIFTNGYLTETKDAYGNALYYCYNDNAYSTSSTSWKPTSSGANKVTSVVRKNVGASATEQLLLLGYNGNRLSTIITECDFSSSTSKDKHRITLGTTTLSNGYLMLTSLTYPDGVTAQYSYFTGASYYNNYRLKTAYDAEANYGIEFSYSYTSNVAHMFEYIKTGSVEYGAKMHAYKRAHLQTVYRYYGKDGVPHSDEDGNVVNSNSTDDILNFRVLDAEGRTISSYSTDYSEQHVLGVGAAAYTTNSGTNKTNNRMTANVSAGQQGVNLLRNSGAENGTSNWSNAGTSSSEHYTGAKSFVLGSSPLSQSVTLSAGKEYTFSAYVKIPKTVSFSSGGGVYVAFTNSSGTNYSSSEIVNYTSVNIDQGWMRLTVSYTPSSSGTYYVAVKGSGFSGTIYVDALQLEQEDAASTYNLIEEGSLENTTSIPTSSSFGWYRSGDCSMGNTLPTYFGQKYVAIYGGSGLKRISQSVKLNLPLDSAFLLSGWAKANAKPDSVAEKSADSDPYFGLVIRLYYSDNTSEVFYFPFDAYYHDWQYVQGIVVPKKTGSVTITEAAVVAAYDNNINTAYFDNISLRLEPAQTYRYNSDGHMTSATQSQAGKESYTYSGADLIGQTAANGTEYAYEYNAQHDVTGAAADGISNAYTYDTAGNMLSSKLTNTKDSQYLYSSATATTDRNSTATVTDVNGNKTTYTYNGYTGQINAVTNAKNQTINYLYTETNGRAEQTYQSDIASIVYSYSKGSLSGLSRKTFKNGTEQWQKYGFSTNNWGQTTAITVSGSTNGTSWSSAKTLASYSYAANNGNLTRMTYGNGQYVNYTYDAFDRVVRMEYNSGRYITYRYNAEGALAEMTYGDGSTKLGSYTYEYDSLGRLIRSNEYDGSGNAVQRTEHKYDAYNRLKSQAWTVGSTAYSESYTYDDPNAATGKTSGDGSLLQMTTATGATIDFSYDTLKRLNQETVKSGSTTVMTTAYAYRTVSGNRSSAQIEYRNVRNSAGTLLEGKKYTYDALGNITMISQSTGSYYPLVAYEYDAQNQLVKETYYDGKGTDSSNVTATYTYTYDTAGNLLSVKKDGTTVQTYTYGDTAWKDLMTAFNGKAITYDASGNPLTYGSWDFAWQNGRQLSTAEKTEGMTDTTLSYAYDASGIRTSKTYTVETYEDSYTVTFVADGTTVKTMTVNNGYVLQAGDYPTVPAKTGYSGTWQQHTAAIHADVTIQAVYTQLQYTVTFVADGTTVKTMTVNYGYVLQSSDYPTVPAKTGYSGTWQQHTAAIHADVTIQAVYTQLQYTVTFIADGVTVKTMTVDDGYVLQAGDYPAVPAKTGYTGAWKKYSSEIHSDLTIKASYTIKTYLVTFVCGTELIARKSYSYGYILKSSDYPKLPDGYAWKPYTQPITSHITIHAVEISTVAQYTVTFRANSVTVKTMTVDDGYQLKDSDYPAVPARRGYAGRWNKYTGAIHEDITITAVYERIIVIPPQPTNPPEIMSVDDFELMALNTPEEELVVTDSAAAVSVPADAGMPAENETALLSTHEGQVLVSTQTVQHDYVTQSGKIVRETIRTNGTVTAVMDFIYDESGRPFAFKHSTNGSSFTTYYYVLNLQGDVVKLITASGATVAEYTYNAWGEVLTATGEKASINPLRYRGYYYDTETGFYYLQSRYYDPAMHRFINADSLASTGQGFVGTNMYAYCNNNPIAYKDPQGKYYVEFNTVGSVETAEGSTIDGITYYTTTIEYTTTIYTGSLYELFFGPRSYSSKVEITFSIDSNSIVHIDNEKNANKQLNDSSVSKALATEVISSARTREPDALSGRTVEGVAMEIRIHYGIYSFGIKSHVDVADIGGTDKSKPGYDSNASFFERFCLL